MDNVLEDVAGRTGYQALIHEVIIAEGTQTG